MIEVGRAVVVGTLARMEGGKAREEAPSDKDIQGFKTADEMLRQAAACLHEIGEIESTAIIPSPVWVNDEAENG